MGRHAGTHVLLALYDIDHDERTPAIRWRLHVAQKVLNRYGPTHGLLLLCTKKYRYYVDSFKKDF